MISGLYLLVILTVSHTTRLRQDIVNTIPDIKEIQRSSGCWDLVFDEDLSQAVQEMKDSTSPDMQILAQAVKILRRDILDKMQMFSGSFSDTSKADSVVPTLRSFLHYADRWPLHRC